MARNVVVDVSELERFFAQMPTRAALALGRGLLQVGEEAMTASKRIVPVDTGTLRGSATVDGPSGVNPIEVELGYGGAASAYALIQHEARHFIHRGQGQAKYLERPVNEHSKRVSKTVGDALRREFT